MPAVHLAAGRTRGRESAEPAEAPQPGEASQTRRAGVLVQFGRSLFGDTGSKAVEAMLAGASSATSGRLAAVFGTLLLLVAALGVVVQLKDAMNTIWNVKEPEEAGFWWYLRTYLVSFAGILGLGFLLAVSLVLSTIIAALSSWAGPLSLAVGEATNFAVSLAILTALFAMLFKWFPDAEIAWGDVLPGAGVTAILFNVGKMLIGWYIGTQGLESTYGAAASIVVLLIWVYYSAQIVLFGAGDHACLRRRVRLAPIAGRGCCIRVKPHAGRPAIT